MKGSFSLARYMMRTIPSAAAGAGVIGLVVVLANDIQGMAVVWNMLFIVCCGGALGAVIGGLNFRRFVSPMRALIDHIQQLGDALWMCASTRRRSGVLSMWPVPSIAWERRGTG